MINTAGAFEYFLKVHISKLEHELILEEFEVFLVKVGGLETS